MEAGVNAGVVPGILRPEKDLSRWVPIYSSVITAVGIVIVLYAFTALPANRLGLILFASMAAIAELSSVDLFTSSRYSSVSVSGIITIASILVFGQVAGVLAHLASGIMTAVTMTILRRQQHNGGSVSWLQRSGFNVGMYVIAAFIAGQVYVLAGGTAGSVARMASIPPLTALVTAFFLANLTILIGVITLQTGRSPVEIWKQDFQWSVPVNIIGGIIGGGVLALAYQMFAILGLVVFFLPVLSTGYSFRLYVANMKDYVNKLEEVNHSLDEANLGLLETLGAVIDAYDVYTYGHSTQVAVYAEALAEKMNLSREKRAIVVKAALVHDVGKIGIMDSIIGKQGALTDEEFNIVKRHPIIGAEIVGRMKGLQELVPLVRHHHERWDGRGYPDGLAGEGIPLGARILGVADSLDALCSDRPYRARRSFEEVKDEITRCSGTHFDPDVVTAFLALVQEKPRDFFKNSAATVDRAVLMAGMGNVNSGARLLKKSMVPGLERE
ncbi:MAG: HD-GYP domain-containing protein [Ardenticatenaceae bacterium]|nr:HD-GYP domain-containing protein [Ardenticatenaceae bacterium]HBY99531.1 hypothetical protein [Chloroflexota bacterium]